ncbi:MAG: formate dehydrogenase accessory protein FdhE [Nitrospirota bacterium]|nr:formate dehydrogenase accessory protein FdhE [Nitrospirota bacterium]
MNIDHFDPFPSSFSIPPVSQLENIYHNMLRLFTEDGPDAGLLIENQEEMEQMLREGRPLFSRLSETAEFIGFDVIFETFSQLLLHQSTPAPDPFTLVSELVSGREDYWEDLASWWGVEPAMTAVLGTLSAKPYLLATARELKDKLDFSLWQRPRCPVCNAFPSMASVDENGRALFCSLCETEWPYSHPGCVFCGCLDAARVVRSEHGADALWLDLCDSCDRYLKTTDLAQSGPLLSSTTDLETLDLDVAAQEMNYQREALNPVGIRDIG